LAEALTEDCSAGSRNAGAILVTRMGVYYYAGNLDRVAETGEQLLAVHESVLVPDYWYGYAHYFLGIVAYERNLLYTTADHFCRIEQLRYRVATRVFQDVLIGLALVTRARGEADKAREYAASARSFAIEMSDLYAMQISNSFQIL
jgi:hypothetical protein